jgi:transposase
LGGVASTLAAYGAAWAAATGVSLNAATMRRALRRLGRPLNTGR